MGKQVRFYMMPEDERRFLRFVCQDPNVAVLTPSSPDPGLRIIEDPLVSLQHESELRQVLLWNMAFPINENHVRQHRIHEYSMSQAAYVETGEIRYFIETSDSPVIEYTRSLIRGDGRLVRGRIWAEMYRLDEGALTHKGKDFEDWYDKIARWLRRNFTHLKDVDGYFGQEALSWHQKGGQLSDN